MVLGTLLVECQGDTVGFSWFVSRLHFLSPVILRREFTPPLAMDRKNNINIVIIYQAKKWKAYS